MKFWKDNEEQGLFFKDIYDKYRYVYEIENDSDLNWFFKKVYEYKKPNFELEYELSISDLAYWYDNIFNDLVIINNLIENKKIEYPFFITLNPYSGEYVSTQKYDDALAIIEGSK